MTNNDTTATLVQRRFATIIADFALEGDDLAFAEALWPDLLHRACPHGDALRATDLPLLEEALFWALASRAYQARIARDGFVPKSGGAGVPSMGGAGVPARDDNESLSKNKTPTSEDEHKKSAASKIIRRKSPASPSSPASPASHMSHVSSAGKILTHPLTEAYAKAGERYRKLLKEIADRTEKRLKAAADKNGDAPPVDIAAALLPLLNQTDDIVEEALQESARREKELGLH